MNYKLLVAGLATIAMLFYACTKRQSDQVIKSPDNVVTEMAADADAIQFFKLLPLETKSTLNKSVAYHRSERTDFMMSKMQALSKRYKLNERLDQERNVILRQVMLLVDMDKSSKVTAKPGVPNPAARFECTDWYLVTSVDGVPVQEQYLYTTCQVTGDGSYDVDWVGGGGGSITEAMRTCEEKYRDDRSDCENSIKFDTTVAFAVAVAAMGLNFVYTAGAFTGHIAVAFEAALAKAIFSYNQCNTKADRAFGDCKDARKPKEPNPNEPANPLEPSLF